ncbi:MAG: chromosome segregation protein SMC [Patescibacteria group bacterium]
MYLKRLELFGFKSFADKVEIAFQPGVTAVVGPNGCGKSNIADALRWVLGEQSLRALRGARMEDVIFAGSDNRKQLGLAEVELVLDNTDGYLPLAYSEVSVARRLYRSGESEFLINKAPVRLKDIQELFLDTGLGKEAYSVIGQGKIDAILSAKAEDRRAIFEEAAGVVKYKLRKAAAMRRLEETEANLVRVMDLITELESQLGPLQEQALKAEEHGRLQGELTALEINLVGHELAVLDENIARAGAGLDRARERDGELALEEAALEAGIEEAKQKGAALNEEVDRCQQAVFLCDNRAEQERGRQEVIREKARAQGERIQILAAQCESLRARREALVAKYAGQERALREAGLARDEIAAALAESEGRIISREDDLRGLLGREEGLKAEIIEDMNRVAGVRNTLQSAETEARFLEQARAELDRKRGDLGQRAALIAERLAAAEEERALRAEAETRAAGEEQALREKRAGLQASLAGLDGKNQEWRERIRGLESRLGLLEEMERTYQGYFPGVRSVLVEAKNEPFARSIRGLVAELVTVKPGYEVAMETALGSALQSVVIEDDGQAQAAIAYLKRSGRGRATFLPLNMVRGSRASGAALAEALREHGADLAPDLLTYDPAYKGIIDHLLGNTIVAPNLAAAVALAKRTGKVHRIVTTEGEIIGIGGAMTGGALDQRKIQILGRKREIEGLRKEKDAAISFLAKGTGEADRTRQEIARIEAALVELGTKRRELAQALAAADQALENLAAERDRLREEEALTGYQAAEQEARAGELSEKVKACREELAAAEADLARRRAELESVSGELQNRREEREAAVAALGDHRVALAAKTEEEKKHRESLAETERQLAELDESLAAVSREAGEAQAAAGALAEEEARLAGSLAALAGEREEAELRLAAAQAARSGAGQTQRKDEARLRALRRERQGLAEQIHRFELSLGEWRVRTESHRAHLLEEYGPGWEEKIEADWDMDRGEAAAAIETLRAEIRALGPVNPGAIADYEGVRGRYDFLRRQSDDLCRAKESLQHIIAEIERTIGRRFLDTFEAVRQVFTSLFRQLFAGGKADLLLLDPGNPLESGIEVVAQPPGKRLQSLSLLSGGERAMTAIALLFSILEVKPSPFCILDEIDATLDEANVARFAELLSSFSRRMQFIVVTHRRGTMELADALYGVTMEEMGVSKLISLQLREEAV